MSDLQSVINYLSVWVSGLTAEDWYVAGTVVGSILVTIGAVAWIKRKYLAKNGKKLASEFIVLNVGFWSALLTVTGFVITQGTAFAGLLPFLGTHWPQISSGAIATHAVATALHKFWLDRKNGKSILDTNVDGVIDTVKPAVEALKPIPRISSDVWV